MSRKNEGENSLFCPKLRLADLARPQTAAFGFTDGQSGGIAFNISAADSVVAAPARCSVYNASVTFGFYAFRLPFCFLLCLFFG